MLYTNPFLLALVFSSGAVVQAQYSPPGASPTVQATSPEMRSQSVTPSGSVLCPWLTQGSAASILAADVVVAADVSEKGEGSCRFSRQRGSADFLEIRVSKAPLSTCPAKSEELKGIGSGAVRCSMRGSQGEAVEMVSSRVRDRSFTVTLNSRKRTGAARTSSPKEDTLEQIAEQVAGNLY
jgi:hypothetical protein